MSLPSYGPLARWYDAFTRDVPYGDFVDYYERLLLRDGRARALTLLDLCCGTGGMTLPLAARGHELIGVDASPEMLSVAAAKAERTDYPVRPMFLCQQAAELDLYGTVAGALCGLDGVNYLPPGDLPELFYRLHLFIEPGGVFAFDFHSPDHLRDLDGEIFADETEDALCLWRGEYDEEEGLLAYSMDIFRRDGGGVLWRREQEEHVEYAHRPERLARLLAQCGFTDVTLRADGPQHEMGRLFLSGVNLPH